jgi:hypothetical protein
VHRRLGGRQQRFGKPLAVHIVKYDRVRTPS